MKQEVIDFVQGKRIALVGASRSGKKFGNAIFTELKQRGYEVYLVHPEAEEIAGERTYPSLEALTGKVDGVVICVPPAKAEAPLREAVAAGIHNIWLQQGSSSPEVMAVATELGITPVTGKCILMYADPVKGFHGFHREIARVFGQL